MDKRCEDAAQSLRSNVVANAPLLFLEDLSKLYKPLISQERLSQTDITIEIDFIFRQVFDEDILRRESEGNAFNSFHSFVLFTIELGSLLQDFSDSKEIDLTLHFMHLYKIPFVLLDDLIMTLTVSQIEAIWDKVESIIFKLHRTSFFVKGIMKSLPYSYYYCLNIFYRSVNRA